MLTNTASGRNQFPPLDDVEIALLQEKMREGRISYQPIDDDIVDFVREIANGGEVCACTPDPCPRCGDFDRTEDTARAIIRRLDE